MLQAPKIHNSSLIPVSQFVSVTSMGKKFEIFAVNSFSHLAIKLIDKKTSKLHQMLPQHAVGVSEKGHQLAVP